MSKYAVFSFGIFMLLIGIGIGFAFTPEYASMIREKSSPMTELGKADRNLDLRYINGMIAHHLSAIDMAKQASDLSARKEIRDISRLIIDDDTKGIENLYTMKRLWYRDEQKIINFSRINLGTRDDLFDLRLLNGLIVHHEEAIEKAKEMLGKSTRTDVLNLANAVITSLSKSLEQLNAWRSAWYGI